MKQHLYALLIVLFAASACSNEENLITEAINEPESTELFRAAASMPGSTPATRLNLTEKGSTGSEYLEVTWKDANDQFSVFAGASATEPTTLTWESNETDQKAIFAGNMIPGRGTDYYAFYPVTTSTDPTSVTLDMTGQNGTLMSEKMFMYSGISKLKNHELLFSFKHLTAVLKVTLEFKKDVMKGDNVNLDAGGVVSRMAEDDPVTNIRFTGDGLLVEETVDITKADETTGVRITEKKEGNIFFNDKENIKLDDSGDKYTTTFYLHLLPADELKNFLVRVKVGNDYYEGLISNSTSIKQKNYYTTTVDMNKIEVGDFMLASGKTIDPNDYETVKDSDPAIGVVAYLYQDETADYPTPDNQIVTLSDEDPAMGLVMALKNASTPCQWTENSATLSNYITQYNEAYTNESGTTSNGYYLKEQMGDNLSNFTAANKAAEYENTVTAPENTSGWYLPSVGEWMLMLGRNGLGGCAGVENNVITGESNKTGDGTLANDNKTGIVDKLNGNLSTQLGTSDYDPFSSTSNTWYWSATESGIGEAWFVYFETYSRLKYVYFNGAGKATPSYVRAILAF